MLHVGHALLNESVPSSAKEQREITTFTVLMTTSACNRKSLILCIEFKSAQTNPVVGVLRQHCKMRTRWDNRKNSHSCVFIFK